MNEVILKYANSLNANSEVMSWLNTTGKKALKKNLTDQYELEHVLDFLVSDAAPNRLQKMSIKDAKRKAKEWSEANQKKGRDLIDSDNDIEVIHKFKDGSTIVKLLTKKAFQREGFLMSHCLGGYDPDRQGLMIYSYRDKHNLPHATFEVQKDNEEIVQIKGKGNGPIHPKYIYPILEFLKHIGMDIRPSDMRNLGYYHLHKDHMEFLKQIPKAWAQICEVNGKYYAID